MTLIDIATESVTKSTLNDSVVALCGMLSKKAFWVTALISVAAVSIIVLLVVIITGKDGNEMPIETIVETKLGKI